jgi:hypothetical protein
VDTKEEIMRAVPVFAANKGSTLAGLIAALQRAGFDKSLATDLVEFLPLAFARASLEGRGVKFAEYYVRVDGQKRERARKKLIEQPVYREALGLVLDVKRQGTDVFMAIASRSPELPTINRALQGGSRPEQVKLPPPTLLWSDDREQPSKPAQPKRAKRAKAWWQFWK